MFVEHGLNDVAGRLVGGRGRTRSGVLSSDQNCVVGRGRCGIDELAGNVLGCTLLGRPVC